jgi:pimeloyl-ACP methyl ester carboxylesterase
MSVAAWQRGSVRVAGGEFQYLHDAHRGQPDRPLVLCLHGFPDHPPTFEPLMAALVAAGYRVAAPWMRGYAPSVASGPYDLDRLARDVIELAQALSPERPVYLVGHDWGAGATYVAAALAPERFAAAVTLAVPHPLAFVRGLARHPAQLGRSWYMLFFQVPGVAERAIATRDFALIDGLWRAWSPGYRLPEPARQALHRCLAASMPAPIEYYRAMLRPLGAALPRMRALDAPVISVPLLHVHGGGDGCIAAEMASGQERYFQGPFESVVIPEVGHFLHVEAPDLVAGRVVAWLARFAISAAH